MILSVVANTAVVASAFIFISTGVVLLLLQPTSTGSEVNNVVFVPPIVYLETT
jgi:hypothetical protein